MLNMNYNDQKDLVVYFVDNSIGPRFKGIGAF